MIAELGLRIRADGTREAVGDLDRLRVAAGRTERSFAGAATGIHRSTRRLGQATSAHRNLSFAAQNASFQIADFAVQVGAGTSATRAFAQQAPQLLGSFGLIGAAAGAAVAIGGALVPMLFRMGEGAEDATDAIDDFAEALSEYRDAVDAATAKTDDLIERFGDQAVAMRETLMLMQQLEMQEALEAMRNSVRFAATEFEDLFQAVDDFASAQDAISGIGEAFIADADVRFVEEMRRNLAAVASEMGITSDQAVQLRDAIGEIAQASGMDQILSSTAELEQLMLDIFGAVENIPPELQTMLSNVLAAKTTTAELAATMEDAEAAAGGLSSIDLASGIAAGANEALRLAENLNISVAAAAQLARLRADAAAGPVLDPRDPRFDPIAAEAARIREQSGTESPFDPDRIAREQREAAAAARKGRSGGGGGGGVNQAERDLEQFTRTLEGFRTESQAAAADLAELEANFSRFQGQLTPEQVELYGQGIDELRDKLRGAGEEGEGFFDIIESNMPRLSDLFRDGSNAIADMARSIVDMAFQINVLEPLFESLRNMDFGGGGSGGGGFLGNLIGNLLPNERGNAFDSGNVIPFARGGIVNSPTIFPMRNGMGLMGEAGPEAVMPLRRGSDGKLGVEAGGANVNVEVNVIGGPGEPEVTRSNGRIDIDFSKAMESFMASGKGKAVMRNVYGIGAPGMAR